METELTKRDRFKRLAQKRVNEVIKKLEILGHCGNRHSYSYTKDEVEQMFTAIERSLNDARGKFKDASDESFHF